MRKALFNICFVLIYLALASNAFSQKRNCIIYSNILNYLNDKQGRLKFYSVPKNEFVNPMNPLEERKRITGKEQFSFYIIDELRDFSVIMVNDWFFKLMNDKSILNVVYTKDSNEIRSCIFNDKSLIVKSDFRNSFTKDDYFSEKNKKSTIHYVPAIIRFSEILYINDKIALVYVKLRVGVRAGREFVYGFILKKKKHNWKIHKSNVETR